MSTMETLVAYFEPHMDFGAFDASQGVCVCVSRIWILVLLMRRRVCVCVCVYVCCVYGCDRGVREVSIDGRMGKIWYCNRELEVFIYVSFASGGECGREGEGKRERERERERARKREGGYDQLIWILMLLIRCVFRV